MDRLVNEGVDHAATIDVKAAAGRLAGVLEPTPLEVFPSPDLRVALRLKLECLQETGSFKARGAWNQISQLTDEERRVGVVASSSGNHGRAVAWAARRAGVKATIFMPQNAYPNKIRACEAEGAQVVLCEDRAQTDERCREAVELGAIPIPPYAAARTIEGAGTVGLEIARAWPAVEVVLVPTGGGGLLTGVAVAIARTLGDEVAVIGVEPEGAPNLSRALEAGRVVRIDEITTRVQGLCPMDTGAINLALATRYVEGMLTLDDAEIFAGQRRLVEAGWTVEPAGGAAFGALLAGRLPEELLADRDAAHPLRVACVVTGANADPAQLAELTGST